MVVSERYVPLRTEPDVTIQNVLDLKLEHHIAIRSVLVQIRLYFASPSLELCLRPRHSPFVPNSTKRLLVQHGAATSRIRVSQLLHFAKCFQETFLSPLLSCQIFCLMCSHKLASFSTSIYHIVGYLVNSVSHYPIESH